MREFILQIARELYRERPNVDLDEIAAIANIKLAEVLDYFPSDAALTAEAMPALSERIAS